MNDKLTIKDLDNPADCALNFCEHGKDNKDEKAYRTHFIKVEDIEKGFWRLKLL